MNESGLVVVGRRRKSQPAPPHVVADALLEPRRPGARPWLFLDQDEVQPSILVDEAPHRVVMSSIWPAYPRDRIEFLLGDRAGDGTDLEWVLWSDNGSDPTVVRARCRRLQELVNRDLRYAFGQ